MIIPAPRRAVLIVAALLAPLLGLHVASAAVFQTPTVEVPAGARPVVVAGSHPAGLPLPSGVMEVTIALALRNSEALDQLMREQQRPGSAEYNHFLTPAQFADTFSPAPSTVAGVRSWARASGLRVVRVSSNRTLLTLSGTPSQFEAAFHTQLVQRSSSQGSYITPSRPGVLPASLAPHVSAVLGLTTLNPNHHFNISTHMDSRTSRNYQTPAQLNAVYNAPRTATGRRQSVAVITNGNLDAVEADFPQFKRAFSLPNVPLEVVQTAPRGSDTSGNLEYSLDSQYSLAFAPGARSVLAYNGTNLGDVYPLNRFVTERRALTASASYGGCESLAIAVGEFAADENVFKQAVVQGQTFWVSSGDTAADCGFRGPAGVGVDSIPDVSYPASSAYVVAVGGTTLTGLARQPFRETGWSGSGGGFSTVTRTPSWQVPADTFGRRSVPDISLNADPESGFIVVSRGHFIAVGGTSGSAPAWNGIWARMQSVRRVGFAAPGLYRLGPNSLTDITLGGSTQYPAKPGYDLVTGLGTPNIANLLRSFR